MKRFLIKILLFFAFIACLTLIINYIYKKLDKADPDWIAKFSEIPEKIRVCNFGSSHGLYDFNYDDFGEIECFNFALSSQMPSYDLRLFQYYGDRIESGGVVFIPVSYFAFYGIDETETEGFEEKNNRYYSILPSELIKDYEFKVDFYVDYFPSLAAGARLIDVMTGESKNTNEKEWNGKTNLDTAGREAYSVFQRHIVTDKLDKNGKRIVNQEEVDSLYGLINECKKKGITPVMITTPYLHEYTDTIKQYSPDFYEDFYRLIGQVSEDTATAYYDYAFDDRFCNDYNLFLNVDHLNKEGARRFVNVLMKEVVRFGEEDSLLH